MFGRHVGGGLAGQRGHGGPVGGGLRGVDRKAEAADPAASRVIDEQAARRDRPMHQAAFVHGLERGAGAQRDRQHLGHGQALAQQGEDGRAG